MKLQAVLMLSIILSATMSYGEGQQEKKFAAETVALKQGHQKLIDAADQIAVDLAGYNIKSPSFTQATNTLSKLGKDRAWRDLLSRETRTHEQANVQLQSAMKDVRSLLSDASKTVELAKEAEYKVWAKAHPEEAREREIQRRLDAAEVAANNAREEARVAKTAAYRASADAEDAKRQAQNAQQQAVNAQNQARNAQGRADDAENALRNRGFRTW
jgi:hypothetical protein